MSPEKTQKTDEELLQAIVREDEEALAFLYDKYKTILFSIIFRILNNRAEAEDVLQETFLQIWRTAKNFDANRGRGFTWIVTLARSRAIDRVRSIVSQNRIAEKSEAENKDTIVDVEQNTVDLHQRQTVQKIMKELPEEQRKVLHLAYFEGLSQTEIADKIDAPLGTVKTRMRSGMSKLRESFGDKLRKLL